MTVDSNNEEKSGGNKLEHRGVEARVKWYDPGRGYGFVQMEGQEGDIFLHSSVLEGSGAVLLPAGSVMRCDVETCATGLQVARVLSIDVSCATLRSQEEDPDVLAVDLMPEAGVVKFFKPERRFGFVRLDRDGRDAYIAARTLEQCRFTSLTSGQRVRVYVRESSRGPVVVRIESG